jgi:hypothetical protein
MRDIRVFLLVVVLLQYVSIAMPLHEGSGDVLHSFLCCHSVGIPVYRIPRNEKV